MKSGEEAGERGKEEGEGRRGEIGMKKAPRQEGKASKFFKKTNVMI